MQAIHKNENKRGSSKRTNSVGAILYNSERIFGRSEERV